jgi:two-component system LytT family sensor kinase
VLAPTLTASAVIWRTQLDAEDPDPATRIVTIATGEPPSYLLTIGPLLGGRRLLSDDLAMLDRVALIVARRIDTLRLTGERYERMLQEREMRALATEAELRALRAQINPHFLFNALTTVSYLIQHAPARALRALMRLTTLLRSVLRSEGEITTLGRERELIDCYLQIERERFEERLEYLLDVPDALYGVSIPALLVQPLVENAIKHGITGAVDGGLVSVTARLGDELTVVVRNTGLPIGASSTPGFGVGLRSVERRLRHYYGPDARVTLGRDPDGTTIAAIHIPALEADIVETGARGAKV